MLIGVPANTVGATRTAATPRTVTTQMAQRCQAQRPSGPGSAAGVGDASHAALRGA